MNNNEENQEKIKYKTSRKQSIVSGRSKSQESLPTLEFKKIITPGPELETHHKIIFYIFGCSPNGVYIIINHGSQLYIKVHASWAANIDGLGIQWPLDRTKNYTKDIFTTKDLNIAYTQINNEALNFYKEHYNYKMANKTLIADVNLGFYDNIFPDCIVKSDATIKILVSADNPVVRTANYLLNKDIGLLIAVAKDDHSGIQRCIKAAREKILKAAEQETYTCLEDTDELPAHKAPETLNSKNALLFLKPPTKLSMKTIKISSEEKNTSEVLNPNDPKPSH